MNDIHRVVGVDESGKGDFFGPLVVASFLADESDSDKLRALGVRDGKTISDKRLLEIDAKLTAAFPHAVVVIRPSEYNRLYAEIKNLNILLADCHARAIAEILAKASADLVISDKFGKSELIEDALVRRGQSVNLKQVVRGESFVQVAAASIIARATFLKEMELLSEKYGLEIPRGASAIVDEAGRRLVALKGAAELTNVAKLHFKNLGRIINPRLLP